MRLGMRYTPPIQYLPTVDNMYKWYETKVFKAGMISWIMGIKVVTDTKTHYLSMLLETEKEARNVQDFADELMKCFKEERKEI